jgi:hypothetical protein
MDKSLSEIGNLSVAAEYPFKDSDKDVKRREYLVFQPYQQQKCTSFD